jgi:hypothetical protein
MSASSAHTLISPSTTSHTSMQRSNSHGPGHGHKARTASHHHHGHHGHAKRRPSAHAAHTTGHLGTRRGSEGDHGRKAIFQGLTMATVDGKGKKSEEVCFAIWPLLMGRDLDLNHRNLNRMSLISNLDVRALGHLILLLNMGKVKAADQG